MRRAALGLLVVLAAAGCRGESPAPAHEVTIRETPDPLAFVQPAAEHAVGHLAVRVLTAQCGNSSIVGTHAEYNPARPLCVMRLRVRSDDATFHTFDLDAQRLLLSSGPAVAPAPDVMSIKRQPDKVELGARNVVELDLWFEPPTGAQPVALMLRGDLDTDEGGPSVVPAKSREALVRLTFSSG